MRATASVLVVFALAIAMACDDDDADSNGSAGRAGAAGGDTHGLGGEGGNEALAPCLDRADELARPPTGRLPCELLPPGFSS